MLKEIIMLGGGDEVKSVLGGIGGGIWVIPIIILFFSLKIFAIQWAYNKIAPRLISSWGNSTQQFKPLTFDEALTLTLLISFL